MTAKPDLAFTNSSAFVLCQPMTERGTDWIKNNVTTAEFQLSGNTLIIERRYLADIVHGARADGLICEG